MQRSTGTGAALTISDVGETELRQALGQFTTGVTIVTSVDRNLEPVGITANSFSSVSLDPPMVLWSLSNGARSKEAFCNAEYFGVHVLTAEQRELSERFARVGEDKFGGLEWTRGLGSTPLLTEYVARFQCRTTNQYPAGDHIIFVGQVLKCEKNDKRPLVFQGGRYAIAERRMLAHAISGNDPSPNYKEKRRRPPLHRKFRGK